MHVSWSVSWSLTSRCLPAIYSSEWKEGNYIACPQAQLIIPKCVCQQGSCWIFTHHPSRITSLSCYRIFRVHASSSSREGLPPTTGLWPLHPDATSRAAKRLPLLLLLRSLHSDWKYSSMLQPCTIRQNEWTTSLVTLLVVTTSARLYFTHQTLWNSGKNMHSIRTRCRQTTAALCCFVGHPTSASPSQHVLSDILHELNPAAK